MTEQAYLDLLRDIMENGVVKTDRTGTGTKSVFGRQLRFDLSKGFPLITTKRVHFKSIVIELLWFLSGSTNIKYLVDNDCNIWSDWPCKRFNQFIDSKNCSEDEHELALEYAEARVDDKDWATIRPTVKEFTADIKQYDSFAQIYGELGPVYGKQWRYWFACTGEDNKSPIEFEYIDQIIQSIEMLKNQPDSRRNIISAWNVADIEQMDVSGLPPCHFAFQWNTRSVSGHNEPVFIDHDNGNVSTHDKWIEPEFKYKLDCHVNIRSSDFFLGMPFNIASYALLMHLYAKQVNMMPGDLVISTGDTHLYLNHIEQAKLQLSREPYDLPHLLLHDRPSIFDYKPEDIQLFNYQSKEAIKAPIAV